LASRSQHVQYKSEYIAAASGLQGFSFVAYAPNAVLAKLRNNSTPEVTDGQASARQTQGKIYSTLWPMQRADGSLNALGKRTH
jgi:hypothetical protein